MPIVTPLRLQDLPFLLGLSQEAGWGHTEGDWRTALHCGQGYGHRCQQGTLISCVNVTAYGASFAALGMVIVAKSHRSRGLGSRLIQHVLKNNPTHRRIALIAGVRTEPFYHQFGFTSTGEYILKMTKLRPSSLQVKLPASRPSSQTSIPQILEADVVMAPQLDRSELLLRRLQSASQVVTASSTSLSDSLIGYGISHRQGDQLSVGPLVCSSDDIAMQLVQDLTSSHANVRVDTYETRQSSFAKDLQEMLGFSVQSRQQIMLLGGAGHGDLPCFGKSIFCPASQGWL